MRLCLAAALAEKGGHVMSTFRKAFWWTAGPVVALSVLSMAGAGGGGFEGEGGLLGPLYFLWYAAAGVGLLALLLAAGFGAAGEKAAVSGILAGIGVGVVALGLTCFVNLGTFW